MNSQMILTACGVFAAILAFAFAFYTKYESISNKKFKIIFIALFIFDLIFFAYTLSSKEEVNLPPNHVSLTSDKNDPQEAGTTIKWTATALDPENDRIYYKFLLNGQPKTDWSYDSTWCWPTSSVDIGPHTIEVKVKDGNHYADGDDYKDSSFTIFPQQNHPPSINELTSMLNSPRPAGTTIAWLTNATDLDGDQIFYEYFLNGNLIHGWSNDNAWTWEPNEENIGKNQIEVRIQDGKHALPEGFDDHKSSSFEITASETRPNASITVTGSGPAALLASPPSTVPAPIIAHAESWQKTFGGPGNASAHSVQQTNDGGYIIAGSYPYGPRNFDAWLIKTDSSGNRLWDRTFGVNEKASSVRQTTDGGYIITTDPYGSERDDAWLIKTDSLGDTLWDKSFSRSGMDSVQQTNDRGYIIVGTTDSLGSDNRDAWLIKTDSSGNKLWDKSFGGSGRWNFASSVQQTTDGGYIIAGSYSYDPGKLDAWLIKTDSSGNKLWDKTFSGYDDASSVQQTTDGGYIIVGTTDSLGSHDSDAWLIKTDSSGNKLWGRTFGVTGAVFTNSGQKTSDDGYVIVATNVYGQEYKARLIKTDSSGNRLWDKSFGGSGVNIGESVQQTNDGGYIIAGSKDSYAWLIKTDANGN